MVHCATFLQLTPEWSPHLWSSKPGLRVSQRWTRAAQACRSISPTRAGLALLGIAESGRIGVDAESIRTGIEVEDLSRRFFAPAETEEILALAPDAQLAAFFTCWTRKEAFVKALGIGLSAPLDQFRVTVLADEPARLVSVAWDHPDRWSLVDLSEPNVAAALAVEGPPPLLFNVSTLRCPDLMAPMKAKLRLHGTANVRLRSRGRQVTILATRLPISLGAQYRRRIKHLTFIFRPS